MTKVLYQQEQFPISQNLMYNSEAEAIACPKGDIQLVEDLETGFVFNAAFRPELMLYDGNYQNEQALSLVFQQHLGSVAKLVDRHLGRKQLIEVGCGKGFFLETLLGKGFDVTGFDPTYQGENPRIQRRNFMPGVANRAKGFILRHVLEHIPDPIRYLSQIGEANGGGKIYIEVPCFDWICEHRAWFDIFYEHVNYFRLSDFHRMFDNVVDSGKLFGGQYLYVVADLTSFRIPKMDINDRIAFPADFTNTLENRFESDRTAVWGGASKGVIFTLLKARRGDRVSAVIDINPAKQGKFIPATGLVVMSPEEALESLPRDTTIYVMNSNYIGEIQQISNNKFRYIGVDNE